MADFEALKLLRALDEGVAANEVNIELNSMRRQQQVRTHDASLVFDRRNTIERWSR